MWSHKDTTIASLLAKTCPHEHNPICVTWTPLPDLPVLCPWLQRTDRPFWCRPNNPSLWQTKQSPGRPGSVALPLAHRTFLTQLQFQSYLRGLGTVRGNNISLHPCFNNWVSGLNTSTHTQFRTSTHTFSIVIHLNPHPWCHFTNNNTNG